MKSINGHRVQLDGLIVGRVMKLPGGDFVSIKQVCQKLELDFEWMADCTRKESSFGFSFLQYDDDCIIPIEEYPAWLVSVLVIDDLPLMLQHYGHKAVMGACRELMKRPLCRNQMLHAVARFFSSAGLIAA